MTISLLPDVLAGAYDSLKLFSTVEDSGELFEKIVFLGSPFLASKINNVQIRRQVNRASRHSSPLA